MAFEAETTKGVEMSKRDRYALFAWKTSTLYGVSLKERDARIQAAFAQKRLAWVAGAK
jgi:hypothetical protein